MTGDDDRDIPVEAVDDIPTVDGDTFRDRMGGDPSAFDVDEVSVSDVKPPAESLVASFEEDVARAVESAMWHTLIDGAAHEAFVDDLSVSDFRDAIHRLNESGYATDGLTKTDLYVEDDTVPKGAAFFAGDGAADKFADLSDEMVRIQDEGEADATGDELPSVDGFLVERAAEVPSNLIVLVDVDAVGRVPAEARNVPVGMDSTPKVSSPIVVTDPEGVVVVNIAE